VLNVAGFPLSALCGDSLSLLRCSPRPTLARIGAAVLVERHALIAQAFDNFLWCGWDAWIYTLPMRANFTMPI
jgi:hypothetical protein